MTDLFQQDVERLPAEVYCFREGGRAPRGRNELHRPLRRQISPSARGGREGAQKGRGGHEAATGGSGDIAVSDPWVHAIQYCHPSRRLGLLPQVPAIVIHIIVVPQSSCHSLGSSASSAAASRCPARTPQTIILLAHLVVGLALLGWFIFLRGGAGWAVSMSRRIRGARASVFTPLQTAGFFASALAASALGLSLMVVLCWTGFGQGGVLTR